MAASPESRSLSLDLPFKFVGGDPSLDFVNTVDWTPSGLEHDRLGSYDRLVIWARGADLISDPEAAALRKAMESDAGRRKSAYEAARSTRWALHEVFYAVITRQSQLLADALPEFDRLVNRAHQHLQVSIAPGGRRRGRGALRWGWRGMPDQLDCVLWPVVRAAANLLTSSDAGRLRMCAGPDCGWLYVDRSRNGLRRWCEMETCGTLAKSRRRAERRHVQRVRVARSL